MEILIRKEPNGTIYLDKTNAMYFETLHISEAPYNFTKTTIPNDCSDCEPNDFNDDLTFSIDKYNARKEKFELDKLRQQREVECFPIINRGQLWYDTLTSEQINELRSFYRAWLDVTETKIIPTKPSWIK